MTAFLSAVSDEFHRATPGSRFVSYRDVLARSLRILVKDCQVVVQEDLKQGMGDLLETLEKEIQQCHVVVHLVGEMAGAVPKAAELRRLKDRHSRLLEHEPELKDSLDEATNVSYTQWEAYFAFQHGCDRLVFVVDDSVPRSPRFRRDEQQQVSQQRHFERLQNTGEHYEACFDQLDLARKAVASIERFGLRQPSAPPLTPEAIETARKLAPALAYAVGTALRNAAKEATSEFDPAGISAFLNAIDTATLQRELDRRAGLQAIHEYLQDLRHAETTASTPQDLYDLALAELAMGNYLEAILTADRLAVERVRLLETEAERNEQLRVGAINAYLLSSEAAQLAGRRDDAVRSMENAGALVDIEREPVLWADLHEPLADYLLNHAQFDKAEKLINDIVDIREEHQAEGGSGLPKILLAWCRLLDARGQYQGSADVSSRAAKLFSLCSPPDINGVASAIICQSQAFMDLGRMRDAEALMRRVLEMGEKSHGNDHPQVATRLNNLAQLLKETNRIAEAETLMRRALKIWELPNNTDNPKSATCLGNLAALLQKTNRLTEAETLMRRAMAMDMQAYGPEHPAVSVHQNNLAALLVETNRLAEAEPLMRRSIAIVELSYGSNHPRVAMYLNNLAQLLQTTNQIAEAELLTLRVVAIMENSYTRNHPNVATALNNLASLLQSVGRLQEAEPLRKRVCESFYAFGKETGHEHPHMQGAMSNYSTLLQDMGFSEEEALDNIDSNFGGDDQ